MNLSVQHYGLQKYGRFGYLKTRVCLLIVVIGLGFTNLVAQNRDMETAGDILLFAIPAGTLATTLIIGDNKGTWQFTKGFLINQAVTFGLKSIIHKPRPDLSNNNAFPSGHTSTTFQSAAFIQARYGWKYGIPAYLLSGFTAYSRIDADKHDGWDVLAGMVLGIGSTYLFTTQYGKDHLKLSFNIDNNNYMIGFNYKF